MLKGLKRVVEMDTREEDMFGKYFEGKMTEFADEVGAKIRDEI